MTSAMALSPDTEQAYTGIVAPAKYTPITTDTCAQYIARADDYGSGHGDAGRQEEGGGAVAPPADPAGGK